MQINPAPSLEINRCGLYCLILRMVGCLFCILLVTLEGLPPAIRMLGVTQRNLIRLRRILFLFITISLKFALYDLVLNIKSHLSMAIFLCDSGGIQTPNLLIRSQMHYSVMLQSQLFFLNILYLSQFLNIFLFLLLQVYY